VVQHNPVPGTPAPTAVLASREFLALWSASVLSVMGDQLARVALASLVFNRTGSAFAAAATYALTFLPAIVGGALLGQLADRYPRRAVMVATDVVRAVAFTVMALPGMPIWAICALLVAAVLSSPVHQAAAGALLPEILPGELYQRGLAVRAASDQAAQLAGFAVAGSVLLVISPSTALLIDAATFVASAALLLLGVRARPAARTTASGMGLASAMQGVGKVLHDPRRRPLVLLAWLVGFWVVPEGLAVAYVANSGGGPAAVAVLMAAMPAGSIVGAWVITRLVQESHRMLLVGWLAALAGAVLIVTAWSPPLPVTVVLWVISGGCTMAYLVPVQAQFVRATADAERGQAVGLASAGMIAAQGLALLIAGAVAEVLGAAGAIAGAGATGALTAVLIAVRIAPGSRGGARSRRRRRVGPLGQG
jgi:MFS family permease